MSLTTTLYDDCKEMKLLFAIGGFYICLYILYSDISLS